MRKAIAWIEQARKDFAAGVRMARQDAARLARAEQIIRAHEQTGLEGAALDSWMARNAALRAGR